jgi:hypothetical protein
VRESNLIPAFCSSARSLTSASNGAHGRRLHSPCRPRRPFRAPLAQVRTTVSSPSSQVICSPHFPIVSHLLSSSLCRRSGAKAHLGLQGETLFTVYSDICVITFPPDLVVLRLSHSMKIELCRRGLLGFDFVQTRFCRLGHLLIVSSMI